MPGYGYARVSKDDKKTFDTLITNYISKRENLFCLFVLIDSLLPPQKIDVEFINKCGESGIPICLVFTKVDKDKGKFVDSNVEAMCIELKKKWDNLPTYLLSSAEKSVGRKELLVFIEKALSNV